MKTFKIEIRTDATKDDIVKALSQLGAPYLKVKTPDTGTIEVYRMPTAPAASKKSTRRGSKRLNRITKLDDGRIDVDATLQNIGRTHEEILNNVWKKGSVEHRLKVSFGRTKVHV